MNTSIFRSLLWKEFHQQWPFWLAMVFIILMSLGLVSFVETLIQEESDFTYLGVIFSLSMFYALGCGAMLFAAEHDAGTFEFHRSLPVSASKVFLAKVVFASVAVAALPCVTSLPAVWLDRFHGHSLNIAPLAAHWYEYCLVGTGALLILYLSLAWGMLFSLLVKRVLLATFLGAIVGLICTIFVKVLFSKVESYIFLPGVLGALGLAITYLGLGWFRNRRSLTNRIAGLFGMRPSPGHADARYQPEQPQTAIILRRLVWQQWRFSRATMAALLFGIAALFFLAVGSNRFFVLRQQEFYTIHLYVILSIFGALVFMGDQRRQSVLYLAERAVRPWHVWLSRQIVWLAPLVLISISMLVLHVFARAIALRQLAAHGDWEQFVNYPSLWQVTIPVLISWAAIVMTFAAGQFCSMLFRSGLLAVTFALVLSVIMIAWSARMIYLEISPVLTVLPITVAMFLATFLYTPDWMRARSGWRPYVRPLTTVAVPILAIAVALAANRVPVIPTDLWHAQNGRGRVCQHQSSHFTPILDIPHMKLLLSRESHPKCGTGCLSASEGEIRSENADWQAAGTTRPDKQLAALNMGGTR
ncbi:MAG: hypothetical protein JXM70_07415 [Pirellulales bacterium]|nr:hypothetical protein [Pirellulales bacterium]